MAQTEFFPSEQQTELLATAVSGEVELTNAAVNQLPPGARAALNAAIFAGAKVQVEVDITPCPAVRSTVELNGQIVNLFEVHLGNDAPLPVLN